MKKILLFLMFALFCVPWATNAQTTITIGTGTSSDYTLPFNNYYKNSWSEMIYPAELITETGNITSIGFQVAAVATNNLSFSTLTIYMGTTPDAVHASTTSWLPMDNLTEVYSATNVPTPTETGWMTINLDSPFLFDGDENLVIVVSKTATAYSNTLKFNYTAGTSGASLHRRNDSDASYADHPGTNTGTLSANLPNLQLTVVPASGVTCDRPESIEVSEVTAYSANVAWEGGSGTYQLQLKASTDEDWEDFMFGPNTFFDFEELTPGTTYQVRVRSLCGEDPETGEPVASGWKTTSFTTLCAIITSYPWTMNFDNVAGSTSGTTNNLPMCWNYINSCTYSSYKGYPIVYSASATAYSGNNYLRFYSYAYYTSGTTTYDPQDQYAILPEMEGLDGKQISFFARGYNANSTFKVGLMTDPADASTFTAIATQALTTSYEEYTYDIQGEGNYIAIMIEAANASRTTNGVYIDDIKVADPPACPKPQSFVVVDSSVTAHTATLSWASDASAWQISLVNGEEEEIFDVEENPYTFTGLAPETTFTVKVRANCGTIVSEWSVEKNFTTAIACPAPTGLAASGVTSHEATLNWTGTSESYTVMYRTAAYTDGLGESFTGTTIPSGWENKSGLLSTIMNGGSFGTFSQWSFGSNNGVFDQHARINIYGASRYGWLITPQFTVIEGAPLSFDLALTAFSGTVAAPATTGTDDKFVVLVTTDNEASWTILRQWDNAGSEYVYNNIACSATGENVSINMDEYVGQNVRIAFYGESTTSNADNNLHIDNVSCGIYHEAGDWQSFVVNEAPAQLTGLEGGTAYNAKLQGDCGVEGLSVETAAINFSTLPSCSAPAELTCTGVTTTTATFTWTIGDYPACQVEVTNNGVSEYYMANETPYTVEGLNPGTTYTVRVRPLCDTNLWSSTVTITTGFVVPLVEPFNTTSIPAGWSRYEGLLSGVMAGTTTLSPVTGIWTFGTNNGVFDSHAYINIYGTSRDHWLVTPLVLMEDNVELSFDLALTKYSGTVQPITDTLGQDDKFVVLITNDNGASWQVLRQWDNTGSEYVYNNIACSATGEYVTIDLSSYAGQNVAIAFYGESTVTETGSDNNLHIDNVSINYIPTCPKPVDLSAENITSNSATLSWSVSGLENNGWNLAYKKVYETVFTSVEGVTHPYVLEGLDPATTYEFYVIANCGEEDMSDTSSIYTFTTECGMITSFPWTENFDAYTGSTSGTTNNLPVCWNYINTCTYSSYKGYPIIYNSSSSASSTPNSLRFYSYAYYSSGTTTYDPQDQYAILPEMEGLAGKIITMKVKGYNTNSTFYVGLMTDSTDVSTFVPFATQTPTTTYVEYEFTIEGEGHYLAIKMDAANQNQTTRGIYVDDISIIPSLPCSKPQGLAVSDVTNHTATLTWVDSVATAWQISLVQGEEETIIDVDENPYTLTGLDASTAYTVKVRANCGNDGLSYWSTAKNFTTLVACPVPTSLTKTELTAHSAKLGWTENLDATEWVIAYKVTSAAEFIEVPVTENPYTLLGLEPSTGYTFKVKAVCGGIDGESNYSTTTTFTTTTECPAPTNLICESVTTTTATLSWFGGEDDMWEILILQGNDTISSYIVEPEPLYTVENLQPSTTYTFKVRTNCGETWSSAQTFTTAFVIPFVEPFAATSIPAGWTRYSGLLSDVMSGTTLTPISSYWAFASGNGITDTHARLNIYGTTCKYWLVTPAVLMDENVQLTFDMALTVFSSSSSASPTAGNQADDKFAVLITTNGTSWEVLRQWDNAGSEYVYDSIPNTLTEMTIDLSNYANSEYIAIAFYGESTVSGGDNNLHIDNVKIDYIPTCFKPTGLTVSEVTAHTATLSWESDGQAWDIYLEENGDELNGGIQVTENPYILTNLTPASTYLVKVRTDCSSDNNGWSEWSNVVEFTTACEPVTQFPWSDDFEEYSTGNFTTTCWQNEHIEGAGTQIFKIATGSTSSTGDNTTKVLQLPDMNAGTMTKLVLPFMTLPGDNYQFTLDVYRSASTYNSNYVSEGIRVFVSTNGEIEGATELAFIPRQYQVSNDVIGAEDSVGWYTYELPIGISGDCFIILRGESQYCTSTYMDNFVVEEIPATNLTQTIDLASGTNWVSFYVETNLNDLKAALVATGNTTITIQGQTQNATYNPSNGRWTGQLRALDLSQMYMIKLTEPCEITLEGMLVDPSMHPVTIEPGANYIAYPLNTTMTLTNAFAGFGVANDQVQSQLQNANFNGSRWTGQLRTLDPGKGYIYKSASTETRTFTFPSGN